MGRGENGSDEISITCRDNFPSHRNDSSASSDLPARNFPGPPKSARSQEIKQELMRTQSSSSDRIRHERHRQLSHEHRQLLAEKQNLDLVLVKCLNHLQKKVKKLERREIRQKHSSSGESTSQGQTPSIRTVSRECFTPKVLNENPDDDSTISRSISVQLHSECSSDGRSVDPDRFRNETDPIEPELDKLSDRFSSRTVLEEDLLIISGFDQ